MIPVYSHWQKHTTEFPDHGLARPPWVCKYDAASWSLGVHRTIPAPPQVARALGRAGQWFSGVLGEGNRRWRPACCNPGSSQEGTMFPTGWLNAGLLSREWV